jgi:hypothetical protein
VLLFLTEEKKWEEVKPSETDAERDEEGKEREELIPVGPTGRHFHSAVVFDGCMYIFGGKNNGYMNDLHCFDIGKDPLLLHCVYHLFAQMGISLPRSLMENRRTLVV